MVISDTDAVYLYGLDIIAEQLAGVDRYHYVHDGLGSVRQLIDSAGQIAARYAYDPFGVPLAGNGVQNPWQFTGEAWDGEVELLYLRASYYQPETGRFVTKDPRPGDVWRPGTLNRYVYVTNNPADLVDPTGLQCVGPDCGPQPSGVATPDPTPGLVQPEPLPTGTPIPSGGAPTGTAGPTLPPEPSPRPTAVLPVGTPRPCALPTARPAPEPMPFEEWKARFPADPYRGLWPVPRMRFMLEAIAVYRNQAPTAPSAARNGTDNPLADINAMRGQIGLLAIANRGQAPFIFAFLIQELSMNGDRLTNFEPYFLTMLKHHHRRPLEKAQVTAYDFMREQGWNAKFVTQLFWKMGVWAHTAMPYDVQ